MTSDLDIRTEKGRESAKLQQLAMDIVFNRDENYLFVHTPLDDAAPIDGFICRQKIIVSMAEVKSRPFLTKNISFTYEMLCDQCHCEWLVSYHKFGPMVQLVRILRVPAYGFLYLPASRLVLGVRLIDEKGYIVCKYRTERTQTQATCNGGIANRINAFIDMKNAAIYRDL